MPTRKSYQRQCEDNEGASYKTTKKAQFFNFIFIVVMSLFSAIIAITLIAALLQR